MSNFDTFAPAVQGDVGTAPKIFVATTDDDLAAITTAGYMSDLFSAGIVKAFDVIFINYDVDGTDASGIFQVTATSGGSIVSYPAAVGGALLVVNNLSDVASVPTSRTNLGLGTADDVVFGSLTLPLGGLHLLDTDASHDLIIQPGSNLTADRILTLTTGDAARTLDISAADVTVSSFGASLVDDAAASNARTTLQIFSGVTADIGGAGAGPISVVVAGMSASSAVVGTLESSSNAVQVQTIVATATGFDVTFSGDPGASAILNYIAVGA